jgi:hypothetical protein
MRTLSNCLPIQSHWYFPHQRDVMPSLQGISFHGLFTLPLGEMLMFSKFPSSPREHPLSLPRKHHCSLGLLASLNERQLLLGSPPLPSRIHYCASKLLDLPKTNNYIHQKPTFPETLTLPLDLRDV